MNQKELIQYLNDFLRVLKEPNTTKVLAIGAITDTVLRMEAAQLKENNIWALQTIPNKQSKT